MSSSECNVQSHDFYIQLIKTCETGKQFYCGNHLHSDVGIKVRIKYIVTQPRFDWFRRLLASICVVNVYGLFMSTGGFIADSIAIVTDLIK